MAVKKLKEKRDSIKVEKALENLRNFAEGEENIIPAILEAVSAYATLGEMCDALRNVFGEYTAPNIF